MLVWRIGVLMSKRHILAMRSSVLIVRRGVLTTRRGVLMIGCSVIRSHRRAESYRALPESLVVFTAGVRGGRESGSADHIAFPGSTRTQQRRHHGFHHSRLWHERLRDVKSTQSRSAACSARYTSVPSRPWPNSIHTPKPVAPWRPPHSATLGTRSSCTVTSERPTTISTTPELTSNLASVLAEFANLLDITNSVSLNILITHPSGVDLEVYHDEVQFKVELSKRIKGNNMYDRTERLMERRALIAVQGWPLSCRSSIVDQMVPLFYGNVRQLVNSSDSLRTGRRRCPLVMIKKSRSHVRRL